MPTHDGVVERGLSLIQESGMAACLEPPRLFRGQLPDLDRFWVDAPIYMNGCLNSTATTANAGFKSPYEAYFGKLQPTNNPRVHTARVPPRSTRPQVGAQGGEVLLHQHRL